MVTLRRKSLQVSLLLVDGKENYDGERRKLESMVPTEAYVHSALKLLTVSMQQ